MLKKLVRWCRPGLEVFAIGVVSVLLGVVLARWFVFVAWLVLPR